MSAFGDNCPLVLSPRQLLDIPSNEVAILDASWHMPNSPRNARKEFLQKRLPKARYLDLDEVASPHELGLMHMMPDGEVFAKACESLGISPSSHVVLYDTHGVFSSPRALFMFRAFGHHRSSILDGGLPHWEAHGCPTESGEPQPVARGKYPPLSLDTSVIRDYQQMISNANYSPDDPAAQIVLDARPRGRYLGTDPEPRPNLPSGHIPHSFSLPFSLFLKTNTYKSTGHSEPISYTTLRPTSEILEELRATLGDQRLQEIIEGKRGVVTSCGSGMTAGILWLGLKLLGVEKVQLYDESWTGYASRSESPIVKGEHD
ncbi:Rhodanese-like protein [Panus rudis PR-1116 ss-1]|nr:Rhodanese-like protein [Panus rudis PR-1116 ss-1]